MPSRAPEPVQLADPPIDNQGGFLAGKKKDRKYLIHHKLSIECEMEFHLRSIDLAAGTRLEHVIGGLLKMEKLYNEGKHTDFGFEFKNMLYRLNKVSERIDPMLWQCGLFIRPIDADLTKVPSDQEIQGYVNDWNEAGIPYDFFRRTLGDFNSILKILCEQPTQTSYPSGEVAFKGGFANWFSKPKSTTSTSSSPLPGETSPSSPK